MHDLATFVQWFDSAEEATYTARKESEQARDYYDGKQWTEQEQSALKDRGQPVVTLNRVAPKIDYLLGTEIRLRADPKAYPRTPNEEGAAECATEAIRFVCDDNNWDRERSSAYEPMVIEGVGGAEVRVELRNGKARVRVEHVPWDRLWWDPRSRYADFRDAKYFGTVLWMDLEDALANPKWEHARDALEASVNNDQSLDTTHDDRPRFGVWTDSANGRKRVKICQVQYHVGDVWYVATYTSSGFLEEPRESPYRDEHGSTIPCLILYSCKVDRENARYGLVKPLISPQDEINKRRSKALHLLSMRQTIAERGAVDDPRKAREELSKPDGYIEINPNMRFEIGQTSDLAMGQVTLYQDAKQEMDAVGTNAALMGKSDQGQSGRAIMARQQGGMLETQKVFDGLRLWSLEVYRHIWYAIKQFWTHEVWLRVTDSDDHMRWLAINKPVTLRAKLEAEGSDPQAYMAAQLQPGTIGVGAAGGYQAPFSGPSGASSMQPMGQPMPPQPQMPMNLDQVVEIQNHVAELDVDIILDESTDNTVILQQEQFSILADLAGRGLPIPPELIIEASSLRGKKRLLEMLKGGGTDPAQAAAAQQAQQQAVAMAQAAAELEIKQKAADIDKTRADTMATMTDARVKVDRAAREHVSETFGRMPRAGAES